jgi:hypothetical protein
MDTARSYSVDATPKHQNQVVDVILSAAPWACETRCDAVCANLEGIMVLVVRRLSKKFKEGTWVSALIGLPLSKKLDLQSMQLRTFVLLYCLWMWTYANSLSETMLRFPTNGSRKLGPKIKFYCPTFAHLGRSHPVTQSSLTVSCLLLLLPLVHPGWQIHDAWHVSNYLVFVVASVDAVNESNKVQSKALNIRLSGWALLL